MVHGKVIGGGRHLMVFISEQRNRNWLDASYDFDFNWSFINIFIGPTRGKDVKF